MMTVIMRLLLAPMTSDRVERPTTMPVPRREARVVVRQALALQSKKRAFECWGRPPHEPAMKRQYNTTVPFRPGEPHRKRVYTTRRRGNIDPFDRMTKLSGRPQRRLPHVE